MYKYLKDFYCNVINIISASYLMAEHVKNFLLGAEYVYYETATFRGISKNSW